MERPESGLQEPILSFHHVGPKDGTHKGGRCLCLLNYLTGALVIFFYNSLAKPNS